MALFLDHLLCRLDGSDIAVFGQFVVNEWLENTNYEAGADLADVYINELKEVEVIYSSTEIAIHKIQEHTPEIWELIKIFDLVDSSGIEFKKVI